ncbi:MAG: type II toxin-antitoxin system mRNA interferase toxin, RelE/StbE family [Proteobacteria bacterium]|nr:type II toxin-antitoxin system mRNA interferase toxin, RelE/StbE family [Pseudomonadota bacterium]
MPKLFLEKHFIRLSKKLVKNSSIIDAKLTKVLKQLQNNPFDPSLETHKLKGDLQEKYACSLTPDLRIIFKLTSDTIHLIDIGAHDEVY